MEELQQTGPLTINFTLTPDFQQETEAFKKPDQSYAEFCLDAVNFALKKTGYLGLNRLQCRGDDVATGERHGAPKITMAASVIFWGEAKESLFALAGKRNVLTISMKLVDSVNDYCDHLKTAPSRPAQPTGEERPAHVMLH